MAEYPIGPVFVHVARQQAIEHAARIGGKVFLYDEHGFLELVFGMRLGEPLAGDRTSGLP